jgi:hypothetical protein
MTHNINLKEMASHDATKYDSAVTYLEFELDPSDGTNYQVHLMPHRWGGVIAVVNDKTTYLCFKDGELKLLSGKDNEYTRYALKLLIEVTR